MIGSSEERDEFGPRVNIVVEQAVIGAVEGDDFKQAVGRAVGATGRPVSYIDAVAPADEAGLLTAQGKGSGRRGAAALELRGTRRSPPR